MYAHCFVVLIDGTRIQMGVTKELKKSFECTFIKNTRLQETIEWLVLSACPVHSTRGVPKTFSVRLS